MKYTGEYDATCRILAVAFIDRPGRGFIIIDPYQYYSTDSTCYQVIKSNIVNEHLYATIYRIQYIDCRIGLSYHSYKAIYFKAHKFKAHKFKAHIFKAHNISI